MHPESTDVLVIGAGLAGMATALSLPPHLRVAMLSKGPADDCASAWAQGGIAAAQAADDSIEAHVQDTLVAGAGLCPRRRAPHPGARPRGDRLAARARRALHAGRGWPLAAPDARGRPRRAPHRPRGRRHRAGRARRAAAAMPRAAQHQADRTCGRAGSAAGRTRRCRHAPALPRRTGARRRRRYHALAGQPYGAGDGRTGTGLCPDHQPRCRDRRRRGHGLARGLPGGGHGIRAVPPHRAAGGWPRGRPGDRGLRGEGAVLRLPGGERFMPAHDPRAELAPRDIVARAIWAEMSRLDLPYVHLDISHRPRAWLDRHFPP